jgi:hypothetical protein
VRRLARIGLGLAALLALGGCGMVPAGVASTPSQLLYMRMTMRGAVDENAYYLFVINTAANSSEGPEVIAANTSYLGNGLATGYYTHYVMYHQGIFELYRDEPAQQGVTPPAPTALGQPWAYDDSNAASGTLTCTLDTSVLKPSTTSAALQQIELNFITDNEIVLPGAAPSVPRQSDGLGPDGTTFLVVQLENGIVINNNGIAVAGGLFGGVPLSPAYDITDFNVTVESGS